jgi:PAS domain-containing protein
VATINANKWRVHATEKLMEGTFAGFPVKGKADLVLERNGEMAIIDMKWSGAGRRRDLIKNEADLQLVLYSRLTTPDDSFAHTAFFIIDEGKFIARNNEAFKDVVGISPDSDFRDTHQRIWDKMQRTFHWRMEQLRNGKIEVRTTATQKRLEALYMDELLDILELPDADAKYDDYRTLIHLFE